MAFLQKTRPVDATAGAATPVRSRPRRTSPSNWRCAGRQTTTWPGWTWRDVQVIISGAERIHAATLRRFSERFARVQPERHRGPSVYGLAEATVYVATPSRGSRRRSFASTTRSCRPATRSGATDQAGGTRAGQLRPSAIVDGADRRPRHPDQRIRRERSARSGCTATTSRWATGETRNNRSRHSVRQLVDPSPGTPQDRGCAPGTWA